VLWVAVMTLRRTPTATQAAVVPNQIRAHFESVSPASWTWERGSKCSCREIGKTVGGPEGGATSGSRRELGLHLGAGLSLGIQMGEVAGRGGSAIDGYNRACHERTGV
jgi:hypothetical protein